MVDIPLLKQNILNFLSQNGPSVPVRISSVLGSDSFFAGAILSELFAEKKVKISAAKMGRSPVYYLHGQENRLSLLFPHLPDKEKEAYTYLQEKKLVRDTEAIPSIRVAFRMMKDFAAPVMIQTSTGEELFWRWHLASDEEIKALHAAPKLVEAKQATLIEAKPLEVAQQTAKEAEKKPKKRAQSKPDEFSGIIQSYIQKSNLQIVEQSVIRKNAEAHFVVRVPSNVGELNMLVVAKNKKKISDADLTLAHQKGQSKKMITIFMTNGELTKKANEHMEKNLKGYVILKRHT